MRTMLTLEDDNAPKLKAESRRVGRPFHDVVDEALECGLANQRVASSRPTFKVQARDLGDLKPGLSLDNVAELIEQVEDSTFR